MSQNAYAKKTSADFESKLNSASVDVIVQFDNSVDQKKVDNLLKLGAKLKKSFSNGRRFAAFSLPPGQLKKLEDDANVVYITPDRKVGATLEFAAPAVGATIASQYGWTGQGIGVAIIDSGITVNSDFKENGNSRIVYSESFVPGDLKTTDAFGHGTHVAGIVGGNAANSRTADSFRKFQGIAPKVNLINLRVLDAEGSASDTTVIAAIERAIELKATYNIRVINLSLGRPVFESYTLDPLGQAVQAAWQAGIVVVCSAGNMGRFNPSGNQGYGTISSPGNHPYGITVGAVKDNSTASRADDKITTFSSKGPSAIDHVLKPDLVAPGNAIIAALSPGNRLGVKYPETLVPASYYRTNPGNGATAYMKLSGTSMAAPMVSGAVALLLQKTPTLKPDEIKARLMKTATKSFSGPTVSTDPVTGRTYTAYHNILSVGAGYLDIWSALNSTAVFPAGRNAYSPRLLAKRSHQAGFIHQGAQYRLG